MKKTRIKKAPFKGKNKKVVNQPSGVANGPMTPMYKCGGKMKAKKKGK